MLVQRRVLGGFVDVFLEVRVDVSLETPDAYPRVLAVVVVRRRGGCGFSSLTASVCRCGFSSLAASVCRNNLRCLRWGRSVAVVGRRAAVLRKLAHNPLNHTASLDVRQSRYALKWVKRERERFRWVAVGGCVGTFPRNTAGVKTGITGSSVGENKISGSSTTAFGGISTAPGPEGATMTLSRDLLVLSVVGVTRGDGRVYSGALRSGRDWRRGSRVID